MLTLRTLVRNTPRPIAIRALMQCRTNITRALITEDDFGNRVREVAGLVRATDGDRFAIIMFYEPDKKDLAASKIWTHCSCPFYTYHLEVVNSLRKSSDIINSNGELPVVRNPRMIPYLCKHLLALAKLAITVKVRDTTVKKPKAQGPKRHPGPTAVPPVIKRPAAIKPVKPIARPGAKPLARPRMT
jgi:hypothetical protein